MVNLLSEEKVYVSCAKPMHARHKKNKVITFLKDGLELQICQDALMGNNCIT